MHPFAIDATGGLYVDLGLRHPILRVVKSRHAAYCGRIVGPASLAIRPAELRNSSPLAATWGKKQINHTNTSLPFHRALAGDRMVSKRMQTRMTYVFNAGLFAMLTIAIGLPWDGSVRPAAETQRQLAQYCVPQADDPIPQRLYCREPV